MHAKRVHGPTGAFVSGLHHLAVPPCIIRFLLTRVISPTSPLHHSLFNHHQNSPHPNLPVEPLHSVNSMSQAGGGFRSTPSRSQGGQGGRSTPGPAFQNSSAASSLPVPGASTPRPTEADSSVSDSRKRQSKRDEVDTRDGGSTAHPAS